MNPDNRPPKDLEPEICPKCNSRPKKTSRRDDMDGILFVLFTCRCKYLKQWRPDFNNDGEILLWD